MSDLEKVKALRARQLAQLDRVKALAERDAPAEPETGLVEQGMSGLNTGLAKFAGYPVDLATTALNAGASGINALAGTSIPPITDPVGGSGMVLKALSPTISDVQPQTRGQRYARRIGEEFGFGAPAAMTLGALGPLKAAAQTNLPAYLGINAASDVAAGTAGQTSREIAPENNTMDLLATILAGGGAAMTGERLARKAPPAAPSRAAQQKQTNALYKRVQDSGADLTPAAQKRFADEMNARFLAEGGSKYAYPKAAAQVDLLGKNPRMTPYQIEEARRRIYRQVARNPDESVMGATLVDETDAYLKSLKPGDVVSNSVAPGEVVSDLLAARRSAHQGIKHDEVLDAINKAKSRTSTTGTGGNALNAQSQEIRRIYDNEVSLRNWHKAGGYTPDEVAAMRDIVFPSGGERFLRSVGRLSPGTGGLQTAMTTAGGGGGLAAAVATGNPLWGLAAAPSMAGVAAQSAAERIKGKKIDALLEVLLRGGKKEVPKRSSAAQAAIISQLLNAPQ